MCAWIYHNTELSKRNNRIEAAKSKPAFSAAPKSHATKQRKDIAAAKEEH
jgi:hypothetical protein